MRDLEGVLGGRERGGWRFMKTIRAQRLKKTQSRLKNSISLEIFNLDLHNFTAKNRGLVGGSRAILNFFNLSLTAVIVL